MCSLSSEVGCEGLDYQICDGLVNYEYPMEPNRGWAAYWFVLTDTCQKSETIGDLNFPCTPGNPLMPEQSMKNAANPYWGIPQALGGSWGKYFGQLTRKIPRCCQKMLTPQPRRACTLNGPTTNRRQRGRLIAEQFVPWKTSKAKFFGLNLPVRDQQLIKDASSPLAKNHIFGKSNRSLNLEKTKKHQNVNVYSS